MSDRWATFDCYGALVDWMGGIRSTLASLWPDADADHLLRCYHDIEPAVQGCVWINRLGEASDLPRADELPSLAGLPELLDRMMPPP